jgi:hypothetical protein
VEKLVVRAAAADECFFNPKGGGTVPGIRASSCRTKLANGVTSHSTRRNPRVKLKFRLFLALLSLPSGPIVGLVVADSASGSCSDPVNGDTASGAGRAARKPKMSSHWQPHLLWSIRASSLTTTKAKEQESKDDVVVRHELQL